MNFVVLSAKTVRYKSFFILHLIWCLFSMKQRFEWLLPLQSPELFARVVALALRLVSSERRHKFCKICKDETKTERDLSSHIMTCFSSETITSNGRTFCSLRIVHLWHKDKEWRNEGLTYDMFESYFCRVGHSVGQWSQRVDSTDSQRSVDSQPTIDTHDVNGFTDMSLSLTDPTPKQILNTDQHKNILKTVFTMLSTGETHMKNI